MGGLDVIVVGVAVRGVTADGPVGIDIIVLVGFATDAIAGGCGRNGLVAVCCTNCQISALPR